MDGFVGKPAARLARARGATALSLAAALAVLSLPATCRTGEDPATDALLAQLASPDRDTRFHVTYELGKRRETRVFLALLERVEDPREDEDVRRGALHNLVAGGREPELLPYYLRLLRRPEAWLWNEAAEALVPYGSKAREAVPMLLEGIADREGYRRESAAFALGAVADRSVVPALVETLKGGRNRRAAEALGRLKAAEAVPALVRALHHAEFPQVRERAPWALGEIGARDALPEILRAIPRDGCGGDSMAVLRAVVVARRLDGSLPDWVLQAVHCQLDRSDAACGILAETRDPHFAPMIVERLATEDREQRGSAARALRTLTGQDLGEDYTAWRLWLLRQARGGTLPPEPPELASHVARLRSGDPNAALESVAALGKLGDIRAIPALEALYPRLPDLALDLRAETLRALALLGQRRAVHRLIRLFEDRALPDQRRIVLARLEGIADYRVRELVDYHSACPPPELVPTLLRVAGSVFRSQGFFGGGPGSFTLHLAEKALYAPEESSPWREAAEALSAIYGIELLPRDARDASEARHQAQRRWAAFVVPACLERIVAKPDPNDKRGGFENDRANFAAAALEERAGYFVPELVALLLDQRPTGDRGFAIPHGYGREFVELPTVADVAFEALRMAEWWHVMMKRPPVGKWPLNDQVWDFYVRRLDSANEKESERAAAILAKFEGRRFEELGAARGARVIQVLARVAERRDEGALERGRRDGERVAALVALGRIGGPEARRLCRAVVNSGEPALFGAAAEGLARAGDRLGYDLLAELLGADDYYASGPGRVRRALVELTGQDFGPRDPEVTRSSEAWQEYRRSAQAWRTWWKANRERFGKEFHE